MDRKFTPEEVEAFEYKRSLLQTKHMNIDNKKWIYNEGIHTPEQFAKKIDQATKSPWQHEEVKQKLMEQG